MRLIAVFDADKHFSRRKLVIGAFEGALELQKG
jgi:hypothetical protein